MKRLCLRGVLTVLALLVLSLGVVHATELTYSFPTLGAFYFSATNGSGFATNYGPMPYMWTAGDFVTQNFFNGPAIADSAAFDFWVKDVLNGDTETWDILINGNVIGGFIVPDVGGVSTVLHAATVLSFAPIDGEGFYNYTFQLQNTVPGGEGSAAFYATPEPASLLLLGSGAFGLASVLRRKFRV